MPPTIIIAYFRSGFVVVRHASDHQRTLRESALTITAQLLAEGNRRFEVFAEPTWLGTQR
jgi:hypothetical protein